MTPDDEALLDFIVSFMIPKRGMLKSCRSQWDSQPKLLEILRIKPELLHHFGIDPEEVKRELLQTTEKAKEIEANYESITLACRAEWNEWLLQYKALLHV
jgi:hypothetical protein